MALFGKIKQALGQVGRYYTSPDGLQMLQAAFQDMANPGGQAMSSLQQARREAADRERQQQVIADLLARVQGPDAFNPQVNELVGAANVRGRQTGQAPLPFNPVRQAGLDFGDPDTRSAIGNFLGAGGSLGSIETLNNLARGPQREPRLFNTRSGVVSVDEDGNATQIYSDPYAEALAEKQGRATDALTENRLAGAAAARARAARPVGGEGRAVAAPPTGPVATGRRF